MNEKQLNQVAAIQQHKLNLFFEDQPVRAVIDDHGAPWFIVRDICDILGLVDVHVAIRKIPEHHLTGIRLRSGGQMREMKLVDEPGLYRLVLRSDKPQAEPFMEWVTAEVLPSIRKTGSYSLLAAPGLDLDAIRQVIRQELADYTPPRRAATPVSAEEIASFRADIQAGLGISATARKYGRSRSTIKDHTKAERHARLLVLQGEEVQP